MLYADKNVCKYYLQQMRMHMDQELLAEVLAGSGGRCVCTLQLQHFSV